jgi:hypothetical protein
LKVEQFLVYPSNTWWSVGGRITYGRVAPWLLWWKEERKESKRNGELAFASQQSACLGMGKLLGESNRSGASYMHEGKVQVQGQRLPFPSAKELDQKWWVWIEAINVQNMFRMSLSVSPKAAKESPININSLHVQRGCA